MNNIKNKIITNLNLKKILQENNFLKNKFKINFSVMFFSDVRENIQNKKKYDFMRDVTIFADSENFNAIYIPERHFHKYGSIYANPAVIAAYLIPQTRHIRFRTAGISLPLHNPIEIVEWWAINDILSNGRVDLGFGSGWNKQDFIFAPNNYRNRKSICTNNISKVQKLWRGEEVLFWNSDKKQIPVITYPRPYQSDLKIWLLVTQNDEGFIYAGKKGYNIFTMLYGNNLDIMKNKIILYRNSRKSAGLNPDDGIVTLMLHTLLLKNNNQVEQAVKDPFMKYIKNLMEAHLKAAIDQKGGEPLNDIEKKKILEYSYQRYFKTSALFGTVDEGINIVNKAISIGVNEIACLVDFGVDYSIVMKSLLYLKILMNNYQ
ncbi:LLM class flavin-dependent oxidoreductase, PedJ homolog [Candidatus Profftella armatura (Diaphorina cf. continua)]|uniref:LLM class flavin-dependent oxidoreductase, PedJ homolog n=1 Tax=Candidatus Profftella armatura (Diaphorina cf. continua) TaxID=2661583 RepID=A0A7R6W0F4_9PROT|nr:MupA/Atu3671 family FMN-dependent luciferase-like monooxygenase [Candidatus Profftella armatura (Diaphorina cf. continua)]BCG49542.1 LLM class flavin-dependent oxidoreductase, PedJ homolog [Candidatus Profftella armatura (Diaphorina cf. continua)]